MAGRGWLRAGSLLPATLLCALAAGCSSQQSSHRIVAPDRSTDASEGMKVGVVDLLAVAERTQAGRRLLAAATAEVAESVQRARAAQDELDQQLEAGKIATEEYAIRQERLLRDAQSVQQRLPQRRKELLAPLHAKVAALVKRIAEQDGFVLVLVKGRPEVMMVTWHAASDLDLTERVIAELNRLYP